MTEPALTSARMVLAPSSLTQPSEPPGYFDIIPDSRLFFPPKDSQSLKRSTAIAKEKIKGIYSHDPILDQNPNELWRFLVSNLQRPHLAVHLEGTHIQSEGKYMTVVTDFSFRIDVTKYVIPQWTQIVAHPGSYKSSKAGAMATVRATLEEYATSKNQFKEFRLKKFVVWDYERVRGLLTQLVRSTGYRTTVRVTFPMQDYKVVALASNEFSRAAHSQLVRLLCVGSCFCIVFWPAWAIARKRMRDRLDCAYDMAVSADEFYARNCERIRSDVVQRTNRPCEPMDSL